MQFQKKSIATPKKAIGNSKGEGVVKVQILEGKYEAKLEFPRGRGGGAKQKNLLLGGVWIFSATAHLKFSKGNNCTFQRKAVGSQHFGSKISQSTIIIGCDKFIDI